MSSIWDRADPVLRDFAVYQPGKPIEETARELGAEVSDIIKLASNENPLGPSPMAVAAMRRALDSAHLYPDGGGYYLREALAQKLGLTREHTILGNGSNEIIEFLAHGFWEPGSEIITAEHSFVAYRLIATINGARTVEVPSVNFGHDLDAMLRAITPQTRSIFIANPNNPTGTLLDQAAIDRFVAQLPPDVIAVFDEAYFEYVTNPPDTLKFLRDHQNVLVLRTFSKIAGLASARIGYGLGHPELISVLQKTRQPFNANGLGQAGALAALSDQAHYAETKRITDEGRAYFEEQFAQMQLPFVPSAANFVLVKVGDGPAVFRALLAQRVIVRALGGYNLPEWVRISVGTMEQNRACIAALREVLVPK